MHLAQDTDAIFRADVILSFAPLGVSLRVTAAQPHARAIARACEPWRGDPEPGSMPLHLHVVVGNTGTWPLAASIQVTGSRMTLAAPGAEGTADAETLCGTCTVAPDWLRSPERLRDNILEPLVLFLLARRQRIPIHASGFVADGVALVLAGPSGAGKSCLARAADQAGFQVLSDDTIYVQLAPRFKVWGHPQVVHLLPGDAPGSGGVRVRNGRLKHQLPLRSACSRVVASSEAVLCVLAPGGEQAALTPITSAQALSRLWPLDPGFDLLEESIAAALTSLAARGAWCLLLSAHPEEAIAVLRDNLPHLRRSARS